MLPSAFGLVFLSDATLLRPGGSYLPTGGGYHNYEIIEDAYDNLKINSMPRLGPDVLDELRGSRRRKDFIPLYYRGGQIMGAVSPEVFTRIPARTFVKEIGYKHPLPEEFEWFYVEDIELYRDDSDAAEAAPDASVSARNYYAAPLTGQTHTSSGGEGASLTPGRNELGRPFIDRVPEETPNGNEVKYPIGRFHNTWVTHTVPLAHFVPGIAEPLLDNNYGYMYGYPDRDNRDIIYNGNQPTIFSTTDGIRGGSYYKFLNENSNHNTIVEDSGISSSVPAHGPSARTFGRTWTYRYHLPLQNSQMSLYKYAYPFMSSPTPFNLKLEEDARSKSYNDAVSADEFFNKMMPLVMKLAVTTTALFVSTAVAGPLGALAALFTMGVNKPGFIVGQMLAGSLESVIHTHDFVTIPLKNGYSKGHKMPDALLGNALSDNYSVWTLTFPQTETIQTEDGKFIKNRKNPFYKIPVNRLFKSVKEFYDWLEEEKLLGNVNVGFFAMSGLRSPHIKINMEPYMNTDYDIVWEKWSKDFHQPLAYSLPRYDRRPNDTDILYKR